MKKLLGTGLVLILVLVSAAAVWGRGGLEADALIPEPGVNALHIPELIDSRAVPHIELTLQNGNHEFYPGVQSDTKGFNGGYLGPTIRLYRGADATITYTNQIGEMTTVHGHGLHVDGEIDGGPQSRFGPGESWSITIPVQQEAGTSWYHPHMMGKTASQVHAGLAGVYIIEDDNSLSFGLPRDYGVNDIPLVVQDRSFTGGVMNEYSIDRNQLMDGLREDTIVVNGTVDAFHTVPQGWVRLRLLNGSNSRFYRFAFADGRLFSTIATEGGFLHKPVLLESIEMAPGERYEIMVDLSDGAGATLIADLLPADPEDQGRRPVPQAQVLELRVDPSLVSTGRLPETLNDIDYFDRSQATRVRTFDMEMDGNSRNRNRNDDSLPADYRQTFAINGQPMDMSVMNAQVSKGEVEIWRVTGERVPHPFHVHGASFQILTHNGKPVAEEDRGWKDTVVVWEGVTEIILRFDHTATPEFPYMYHCHMLEHEEGGMMGQFTVQ